MASARPAPGGGTPVRPGLVYALCAALIHAAIDTFKLVHPPAGEAAMPFSLGLAVVSALVPFLAFGDRLFQRRPVPLS